MTNGHHSQETLTEFKIVDSVHYHLWTDALHARKLAHDTDNDWNRGAYVRWAVQSAWTSFESLASALLNVEGLGNRFRDSFDEATVAQNIPAIDWGSGTWQQVMDVYSQRKQFAHVRPSIDRGKLLASALLADNAISVIRRAIKELSQLVGQPAPPWVSDDDDSGFSVGKGDTGAHVICIRSGAREQGRDAIRITYLYQDQERVAEILPAGSDYRAAWELLLGKLTVPITTLRAYSGQTLLEEQPIRPR